MTPLPFRSIILATATTLATLGGCASTSVSTVWKAPDHVPVQYTKVLAVVANATPAERRAGEDELVRSIKSAPAVASYTFISDEDVKDKDKVRAAIKGQGFDAAAIIRLVSTDKQTTYTPPRYSNNHDPFQYGYAYQTYSPGYTTTDTIVTAETSFYSVKEEKLIWAGSSSTENPSSITDLIAQVSRGAAAELRAQGLLK